MDLLPNQTGFASDAAKQSMTLENLLTMTSGLASAGGRPHLRQPVPQPKLGRLGPGATHGR